MKCPYKSISVLNTMNENVVCVCTQAILHNAIHFRATAFFPQCVVSQQELYFLKHCIHLLLQTWQCLCVWTNLLLHSLNPTPQFFTFMSAHNFSRTECLWTTGRVRTVGGGEFTDRISSLLASGIILPAL